MLNVSRKEPIRQQSSSTIQMFSDWSGMWQELVLQAAQKMAQLVSGNEQLIR